MILRGRFFFTQLFIMEVKIPAYLKQSKQFELQTTLVNKEGDLFEFQDTIFHLQGGGQPNDKGWISFAGKKYDILGGSIERETGRFRYKLPLEATQLEVGAKVQMSIDSELRQIHAKIHSAGHLIDLAVQRLKYEWETGKGYHFVDGPYVEYKGVANNAEKVAEQLNHELKHILEQGIPTITEVYGWNQAVELKIIPQTFKTSYVRVVRFDTSDCPCGGTHIGNTAQMKELLVTKVQKKGKNVRVFYRTG